MCRKAASPTRASCDNHRITQLQLLKCMALYTTGNVPQSNITYLRLLQQSTRSTAAAAQLYGPVRNRQCAAEQRHQPAPLATVNAQHSCRPSLGRAPAPARCTPPAGWSCLQLSLPKGCGPPWPLPPFAPPGGWSWCRWGLVAGAGGALWLVQVGPCGWCRWGLVAGAGGAGGALWCCVSQQVRNSRCTDARAFTACQKVVPHLVGAGAGCGWCGEAAGICTKSAFEWAVCTNWPLNGWHAQLKPCG